ncbi:hypothetical protein SAMN04488134_101568 [Amphibacillus marinus]|uniref:Uncharacterized protein n=1 Tax=Amphibacillus marinus TaxID=872970 RepID=A0A1H8IBG8_9BACI|nr:hypothetical protein [Amphibacillus marinus]SEN65527.1 hypothetical protein SAMN04488134_101568 [Amphibacillus marinus]
MGNRIYTQLQILGFSDLFLMLFFFLICFFGLFVCLYPIIMWLTRRKMYHVVIYTVTVLATFIIMNYLTVSHPISMKLSFYYLSASSGAMVVWLLVKKIIR